MKLGIVGNGDDKFTPETAFEARTAILNYIESLPETVTHIVSGHSPVGGADIWAEEIAQRLGIETVIFAPKNHSWGAVGGYKDRNIQIATTSDLVLVVVSGQYPETYTGMKFKSCYHCKGRNPWHVKSGGCWTAWRAKKRHWLIIGGPE